MIIQRGAAGTLAAVERVGLAMLIISDVKPTVSHILNKLMGIDDVLKAVLSVTHETQKFDLNDLRFWLSSPVRGY